MENVSRWNTVKKTIEYARKKAPTVQDICVCAVSKKQPVEKILSLLGTPGISSFGENRLTELSQKMKTLHKTVPWNYLGHLQSHQWRAFRKLGVRWSALDSLDPLEWADRQPPENKISCLIQCTLEPQTGRRGAPIESVSKILDSLLASPHFSCEGLMFMPLGERTLEERRKQFEDVFRFWIALKKLYRNKSALATLSMGMSDDYPVAIESGATEIRLGTALFGERIS